eukprot:CAMPEP_0183557194 /NCGR_PEP_ID=MMETSP0371-20130417/84647_1 /TAXON_ID=268820 /ORGANISM="Peridinium aciculiferum, Strain PAER-2" /LENGTH=39 /DNA_ID= /DNA_START= /DNA_END= /DNA_ORIENTATION=
MPASANLRSAAANSAGIHMGRPSHSTQQSSRRRATSAGS